MLKKILNPASCKTCRVCCGFDENDKWEIPLIFSEIHDKVEEITGCKLSKRGSEYVFNMEFDGDKVIYCPALGENGCTLGEFKPFDCLIWPFRVNRLGNFKVITVSPVCRSVITLPLDTLVEFIHKDGFAEKLYSAAQQHPDMVKPYISGYPILDVRED